MSARALRRTPGRERRGSVPSSARAPRVTLSAPCIEGNAWTYLKRCLDTGDVSAGGEYVSRFEAALADYTRAPAVVATSTGTCPLYPSDPADASSGVNPRGRRINKNKSKCLL